MRALLAIAALLFTPAFAQQSASFVVDQQSFNAGGRPLDGVTAGSASFRLSLDAIGSGPRPTVLTGSFFSGESGMVAPLAPPREVQGLLFDSVSAMHWLPDPRGLAYNVYRDGGCDDALVEGTSHAATGTPAAGQAWLYLVTSVNRLIEEGTRGLDSDGNERAGGACF